MILCDSDPALSGVQPYRASHLVHPARNSLPEQKMEPRFPVRLHVKLTTSK